MSYSIRYTPKAYKQLMKLEVEIRERIVLALDRIRFRPERYVKKLVGDPGYRLRVGDYRVIMDLDKGELVILVIKVGYRRGVYG